MQNDKITDSKFEFAGASGGAGGGFAAGGGMPVPAIGNTAVNSQQKSVDKIRSVFPETWLWGNSSVG